MKGPQSAVAADTTGVYRELELGRLPTKKQTIKLPRKTGWAAAFGSFGN